MSERTRVIVVAGGTEDAASVYFDLTQDEISTLQAISKKLAEDGRGYMYLVTPEDLANDRHGQFKYEILVADLVELRRGVDAKP